MKEEDLRLIRGRILHVLGDVEALAERINTLMGCQTMKGKPFPVLYLRRQRGWSPARLVAELQRAAVTCGHPVPEKRALEELVSGWERGLAPGAFHRELLRMVFRPESGRSKKGAA